MILNPYRERLRILLILYFFSDDYNNPANPELVKVFRTETKIQKIDFLIRYPGYLCFELLRSYEELNNPTIDEVREIVKSVFRDQEPRLRTDEMKRFFYGAYEELDDVIAYLKAVNLIEFKSLRSAGLKDIRKEYFVTKYGAEKIEQGFRTIESAKWYFARCQLIKQFFGDLKASELKERQYAIEVYRETLLGSYIADIEEQVRTKFYNLFEENL
jgi:hypothetical protein